MYFSGWLANAAAVSGSDSWPVASSSETFPGPAINVKCEIDLFSFLLQRFDFMKSKLLFESFSNGSKSVNLVSHSLLAYDTRYSGPSKSTDGADGARPNVFDCILQPSKTGTNRATLQLELHYR